MTNKLRAWLHFERTSLIVGALFGMFYRKIFVDMPNFLNFLNLYTKPVELFTDNQGVIVLFGIIFYSLLFAIVHYKLRGTKLA